MASLFFMNSGGLTVLTPLTDFIFLTSIFSELVSLTSTAKLPWNIPVYRIYVQRTGVTPFSFPITEVMMLVTIAISSLPTTRRVTTYPLSPLPLHLAWMMR